MLGINVWKVKNVKVGLLENRGHDYELDFENEKTRVVNSKLLHISHRLINLENLKRFSNVKYACYQNRNKSCLP